MNYASNWFSIAWNASPEGLRIKYTVSILWNLNSVSNLLSLNLSNTANVQASFVIHSCIIIVSNVHIEYKLNLKFTLLNHFDYSEIDTKFVEASEKERNFQDAIKVINRIKSIQSIATDIESVSNKRGNTVGGENCFLNSKCPLETLIATQTKINSTF